MMNRSLTLFAHPAVKRSCWRSRLFFSDFGARGHDITADSLSWGDRPKVVLQGYAPTGFDVMNQVKKVDPKFKTESGSLHMNGSIIAFPFGCFLWNVDKPEHVTLESLSAIQLHRPKLEYLFIGCNSPIPMKELDRIKLAMLSIGIVAEKMDCANAMGTFNILNAEDRAVAVALVIDSTED
jgi:uncharacterized protein